MASHHQPSHPANPAFTVPPQATVLITGDPGSLTQLGSTYSALAQEFKNASDNVKGTKDNVFAIWQGAGGRASERAFEVAIGRSQYAPPALDRAAQALYRYAGELAVAIDAQSKAIGQINILVPLNRANPADMNIEADLRRNVQISLDAQTNLAHAANTFHGAMSHVTSTQWYAIPALTPRFDAVTAAILDSLAAHKWISPNDAYLVSQKIETLSAADYNTFTQLESHATTDAQRGHLYKELAGGIPMSTIASTSGVTLPPAVAPSGGIAAAAAPVVIKQTAQPLSPLPRKPAASNGTGGTAAPTTKPKYGKTVVAPPVNQPSANSNPKKPAPKLHYSSGGGG